MGSGPTKEALDPSNLEEELFGYIKDKTHINKKGLKNLLAPYRLTSTDFDKLKDENGNTPLHASVMVQKNQFVQYFISIGCQTRTINNELESPLHSAIRLGNFDIVKSLLYEGGGYNLCLSQNRDGESPLHVVSISLVDSKLNG